MSGTAKSLKLSRYGFSGNKKKTGINYWRFFFYGIDKTTSVEQAFYIEVEMLNPWLSPKETVLGFKPRVAITSEDLQYALAGTKSAKDLKTEDIMQPSYCALRIGKLGSEAKQLCTYFPVKDMKFFAKPFGIEIDNRFFSDNKVSGYIAVEEKEVSEHPEFLCDSGSATWDLTYEYVKDSDCGYTSDEVTWLPVGLKSVFSGTITFDNVDYIIDPRKSRGYVDRFWGKTFPTTWFHISSNNITSIITGSQLFNSAFAVQGTFENKISFIGGFEDIEIDFCADSSSGKYVSIFDCTQAPEAEDPLENLLHWTVSINNKQWIIDIDVYCKISELCNRKLELPEGKRKVLNILESSSGFGEIKLYRKKKNDIEQIENATITKAICQFGNLDETDID